MRPWTSRQVALTRRCVSRRRPHSLSLSLCISFLPLSVSFLSSLTLLCNIFSHCFLLQVSHVFVSYYSELHLLYMFLVSSLFLTLLCLMQFPFSFFISLSPFTSIYGCLSLYLCLCYSLCLSFCLCLYPFFYPFLLLSYFSFCV